MSMVKTIQEIDEGTRFEKKTQTDPQHIMEESI